MIKEFLHHRVAYSVLLSGLLGFILAFFWIWPNREAAQILIFFLLGFYVIWGSIVHTKSTHLKPQIVLEYVATAALAGACLHLLIL